MKIKLVVRGGIRKDELALTLLSNGFSVVYEGDNALIFDTNSVYKPSFLAPDGRPKNTESPLLVSEDDFNIKDLSSSNIAQNYPETSDSSLEEIEEICSDCKLFDSNDCNEELCHDNGVTRVGAIMGDDMIEDSREVCKKGKKVGFAKNHKMGNNIFNIFDE